MLFSSDCCEFQMRRCRFPEYGHIMSLAKLYISRLSLARLENHCSRLWVTSLNHAGKAKQGDEGKKGPQVNYHTCHPGGGDGATLTLPL